MNELMSTNLTMSSREIAALTGKEHKNVKADIEKMLKELEGDALRFQRIYQDSMNREQKEYNLPKRETLILVSGYNIKLRAKIIDRWEELEKSSEVPKLEAQHPAALSANIATQAVLLFRAAGLDQNASLIAASQTGFSFTGVDILKASGLQLGAPKQEQVFTPTELGKMMEPTHSAVKVNRWLEFQGLQEKIGDQWVPTEAAEGLYRLFDTGKKRSSGVAVQQVKWFASVLDKITSDDIF